MRFRLCILLCIAVGFALSMQLAAPGPADAIPDYFTDRCAGCHNDDTPTCNGCHNHMGDLTVSADSAAYMPGSNVVVTLDGGTEGGWIRAILYDESGAELARATGPTGTGDNGQPPRIEFPVPLQATAPLQSGSHRWRAAWFGNFDTGQFGDHDTVGVGVTITVQPPQPTKPITWGVVRRIYQ